MESFRRVVCPVPPLQAPALSQILETQASTGFKDTPQTASMRDVRWREPALRHAVPCVSMSLLSLLNLECCMNGTLSPHSCTKQD